MRKLLKFLEGKKRNIGIILTAVVDGAMIFFPDVLPFEKATWIKGTVNALLLGGMYDAYRRSNKKTK